MPEILNKARHMTWSMIWMRAGIALVAVAALSVLGVGTLSASERLHGYSLLGELKYPPDFTHFDYVNPNAHKGGYVRQSAIGTYDSLNPFILKGQAAGGIGLLYDSLMESSLDEASTYYGGIADSLEIADDNRSVIFNLRPEARWHDGKPITSADVVFSFEALTKRGHPFYRAYWSAVTKIEALGLHQVVFTLNDPNNRELPGILGQLTVLPKHYYDTHDFEKTTLEPPLGSGPYRVLELDAGRSITYQRVADYWGKDLPVHRGRHNFDRIRIDYYLDQTVALEAFKAHEYDFRTENTSKAWATGYDFPAVRNGFVAVEEIRHEIPTGMQAFVLNTRRPMFSDRRVRAALAYTFDFEWSNTNLFYGQYTRTTSFFSNSELASSELPSGEELKILERYRGRVPDEVFTQAFVPPKTDGSGKNRRNLRQAKKLLESAGFNVKERKLVDPNTGEQMEIEFLIAQPAFERIVGPMVKNLARLGIKARIRVVDTAQYQNRTDSFDFDIVVSSFGQSLSPGNEQIDFWHSSKADVDGSRNIIGIRDPVVDELIDEIINAPNRKSLIAATRALDRVLLWGHYVIPQWHIQSFRVAYWNKFSRPKIAPKYGFGFDTWWVDPDKAKALEAGVSSLKKSN